MPKVEASTKTTRRGRSKPSSPTLSKAESIQESNPPSSQTSPDLVAHVPPALKRSAKSKLVLALEMPYSHVGEVFVVGSGDCGQLGLGPDVLEKPRPAKLEYFADKKIVHVAAGGLHNMALSLDGKLYSWGCNDQSALGRSGEETLPAPVEGLDDIKIVRVACGDSTTVALSETGLVYAWGTFRNNSGIFGFTPGTQSQTRPALVSQLKNICHIAAGANHLIAVSADGKIWSWGVGQQAQLGRRIMERHSYESSLTPRPLNFRPHSEKENVKLKPKFKSAFCGAYHTMILHEEPGHVFSIGLNNHGQLGHGDTEEHGAPVAVHGLPDDASVLAVSGGEHHSAILLDNGRLYTCGRGDAGQLGHGDEEMKTEFTLVSALDDVHVRSVSCGSQFTVAVTDEPGNNLYTWGYGEMGQLCNGSEDTSEPFQVELKNRTVIDAAAGGQHTVLLIRPKEQ